MDIVVIEFRTEYSGQRAVDWVLTAPRGDAMESAQTWHRIKDLRPKEGAAEGDSAFAQAARWKAIQPKYDAWKASETLPEDGTPLAAWPGVTGDQAAFLKRMGITAVEHVRDMTDSTIAKLPFPDARKLPGLAKAYLEAQTAVEKDRELEDMRERMAAMEAMLAEKLELPVDEAGQPLTETFAPKRGRPRKAA